jgi:hypothetical protein
MFSHVVIRKASIQMMKFLNLLTLYTISLFPVDCSPFFFSFFCLFFFFGPISEQSIFCRSGGILGLAMACSNTFGLVTGAFLLGFGLGEIPKGIWKNADWTARQKVLTHKVAKMAVKLDDAHQEFSNAIVVSVTPFLKAKVLFGILI